MPWLLSLIATRDSLLADMQSDDGYRRGQANERRELLALVQNAKQRAVKSWDNPYESSPGEVVCDLLESYLEERGGSEPPLPPDAARAES